MKRVPVFLFLVYFSVFFPAFAEKNGGNGLSFIYLRTPGKTNPVQSEKAAKDELYAGWLQLDRILSEADAASYTSAAEEKVESSLFRFVEQVNLYEKSSFYQTAALQYPEFNTAFRAVQAVQHRISIRLKEPAPLSPGEVQSLRNGLQSAMISYLNERTVIAEHSGTLYAELLITFSVFVLVIIIVIFMYRKRMVLAELRQAEADRQNQNTSLFAQAVMQGQEEERSRISLELHDTVAQNIKYAQLLVEQLKPHLPEDAGVRNLSDRIADVDLRCIRDIRTLCYNLTPPDLERGDLAAALSHFCTTFSHDSGVPCTIVVAEGAPLGALDARQRLHCFRLVQEALNNAAKHASPSETSVIIRGTDKGTLLILITDDGTGMEAEQLSEENGISGSEHFGIKGMRERVESMHGTIGFNSAQGEGTEVRIELPLLYRGLQT